MQLQLCTERKCTVASIHSKGGANSCNYPQQRWRTVAIIHSKGGEQLQLSSCKGDVKSSVLTKNDNRTELAWTRVTEHPLTQRTHIIKCPFLVYQQGQDILSAMVVSAIIWTERCVQDDFFCLLFALAQNQTQSHLLPHFLCNIHSRNWSEG